MAEILIGIYIAIAMVFMMPTLQEAEQNNLSWLDRMRGLLYCVLWPGLIVATGFAVLHTLRKR